MGWVWVCMVMRGASPFFISSPFGTTCCRELCSSLFPNTHSQIFLPSTSSLSLRRAQKSVHKLLIACNMSSQPSAPLAPYQKLWEQLTASLLPIAWEGHTCASQLHCPTFAIPFFDCMKTPCSFGIHNSMVHIPSMSKNKWNEKPTSWQRQTVEQPQSSSFSFGLSATFVSGSEYKSFISSGSPSTTSF
jgi:hypothetical protein